MNANELADYLDNNVEAMLMSEQPHIDQAATMLRQQQVEIEALKEKVKQNADLEQKVDLCKEKLEPVAWINLDRFKDEALYLADCVSENKVDNMGITIPLYIHPAKELTDEEILREAYYILMREQQRKAQEK